MPNDKPKQEEKSQKVAAAKKPARKYGIELEEIAKLKVLCWMREVIRIAGCSPWKLQDMFIGMPEGGEFGMYAAGTRFPSDATVKAVSQAQTRGLKPTKPFLTTPRYFYFGPEGLDLWSVLVGDLDVCREIVDGYVLEITDLEKIRFGMPISEKVKVFHDHLIPEPLRRFVDFEGALASATIGVKSGGKIETRPVVTYLDGMVDVKNEKTLNVVALTSWLPEAPDSDNPTFMELKSLGVRYEGKTVVATLALWQLCNAQRDSFVQADYFVVGLLRNAIDSAFPSIGEELTLYLLRNWFFGLVKKRFE